MARGRAQGARRRVRVALLAVLWPPLPCVPHAPRERPLPRLAPNRYL